MRVRIPATLIRLGDDGWTAQRFPDGWWMETLRRLGVPFKAVVETWPRFTDAQHAEHVARLVHRVRPDVVILGNEVNADHRRPGVDTGAVVERYLDRYAAMRAPWRASPRRGCSSTARPTTATRPTLDAFLRHLLAGLRRRALPPPDLAGIHVYDGGAVLPERVAAYRRLLAEYDLRLPLSVEELGPRQGVVDRWEARLELAPAADDGAYAHRLEELHGEGWLTEDEQAEQVAQHLATAAACADQAQIFCALDFDAEIDRRRGLVSRDGRPAPPWPPSASCSACSTTRRRCACSRPPRTGRDRRLPGAPGRHHGHPVLERHARRRPRRSPWPRPGRSRSRPSPSSATPGASWCRPPRRRRGR